METGMQVFFNRGDITGYDSHTKTQNLRLTW